MDFESFKKAFADKLRQLRNNRKISAREMSLALGQNVNYINYIENGRHMPSMQGFFLICEYLDIPPEAFFKTECAPSPSAVANMTIFSSLTKREQESIIAMIQELKA